MRSTEPNLLLNAQYIVELPELWFTVPKTDLRIRRDYGTLFMERLPDESDRSSLGTDTRIIYEDYVIPTPFAANILRRLVTLEVNEQIHPHDLKPIPSHPDVRGASWMPDEFWKELNGHRETLDARACEIVNSLCWRLGVHDGPSVLRSTLPQLRYSFDDSAKFRFPVVGYFKWDPDNFPRSRTAAEVEAVLEMVGTASFAPLHHAVFQEADRRRYSEPRVAIVMAVVAAESAIKSLIAELLPQTRWLLENLQSPPITKIVEELLPSVPAKLLIDGKVLKPPKSVRKALHSAVNLRNNIVHGRSVDVSVEDIDTMLGKIRDFILLMDFYGGHGWAFPLISKETRDEIRVEAAAM